MKIKPRRSTHSNSFRVGASGKGRGRDRGRACERERQVKVKLIYLLVENVDGRMSAFESSLLLGGKWSLKKQVNLNIHALDRHKVCHKWIEKHASSKKGSTMTGYDWLGLNYLTHQKIYNGDTLCTCQKNCTESVTSGQILVTTFQLYVKW